MWFFPSCFHFILSLIFLCLICFFCHFYLANKSWFSLVAFHFVCINRVKNGIKSNIACHSNQFVHISIWRWWWDKIALCVVFSFFFIFVDPCARCRPHCLFHYFIILLWMRERLSFHLAEYCQFNSHKMHMQLNSHNNKMRNTFYIRGFLLNAHIKPPIGLEENTLKTTKTSCLICEFVRARTQLSFNSITQTNAIHIRTYEQHDTDTVTHMRITIKMAFRKHYFPFFWLSMAMRSFALFPCLLLMPRYQDC